MVSTPQPAPPTERPAPRDGIVAHGWLAGTSVFGSQDEHRLKRAAGASVATIVVHGVVVLIIVLALAGGAASVIEERPLEFVRVVFMDDPGPGGGGGGSPEPAPPQEISIPEPQPREPIPVVPPPEPQIPPPPIPRLTAPVMTPNADTVRASGDSFVGLAPYSGGGGRGEGVGSGSGDGVGPGTGGGFGDGAYRSGSGVTPPSLLREFKPNYTSEAMRLKLQGSVQLQVVILADGTVGQARITRSLDSIHGLDDEALKAARRWLFVPARDRNGQPVAYIADLILDFRLH